MADMKRMDTEELAAFHDNLADVLARDGEEAAQTYLGQHLQRLPGELRDEIVARTFFDEIVNEAREIEAVAQAQQEGIAALEALEAIKKELEKGKQGGSIDKG